MIHGVLLNTMVDSMVEQLRSDMECEELLACFHGLRPLDRQCFQKFVEADEPLTVDEIATVVGRERSTAYRSIRRLLQTGFLEKEQINYEQGSYYHVYSPTNPSVIANEMQRLLNDWYAQMGQLIQEFENKYRDTDVSPTEAEA